MAALEDLVIKFSADTSNANSGIESLGQKLAQTEKSADSFGSTFERVFDRVAEYLAAREIIKGILDIASGIDEISHQAEIMGTSIENFTRLTYAAHQADLSTEQLTNSVKFMQRALETAASNQNLTDAFNKLQVNVKSVIDLKPEQQLAKIADGFKNLKTPADQTRVAMELFGRSGTLMIPFLKEGSEGLKQLGIDADAAGATISTAAGDAARRYEEEMHRLTDAWEGAKAKLAETGVFQAMADDIEKLIPWIVKLGDGFAHIGDRFQDFKAMVGGLARGGSATDSGMNYTLSHLSESGLQGKSGLDPNDPDLQGEIKRRAQQSVDAKSGLNNLVQFFGWGNSIDDVSKNLQSGLTSVLPTSGGDVKQSGKFTPNVSDEQKKKALEDQKKLQDEINKLMGQSETVQDKLNDDMARAYDLRHANLIDEQTFNTIMSGLGTKMDEANRKLDTMDNKVKDIANSFFDDVGNSIEKAFQKGGGGAKAMWKDFEADGMKAVQEIAMEMIKSGLMKALGAQPGDSNKGIGDLLVSGFSKLFGGGSSSDAMPDSFLNASDAEIASFDTGGYTGMGGGSGIDGKGGFMAVLHPDEQVLNGNQWRSMGGARGSGGSVNNNIVIQATNQNDIDRRLMAALPLITDHVTNAVLSNMNSGGNMTRAIQRRV